MTTVQESYTNRKEDKNKQSQNSFKKTITKNASTSGLGSEIHNANGANSSYADNDNDDEILYGYEFQMTDDQKKAAGELQNLKLDLGFTEDEPGPFYDVSERLKQLNEELAQEQIPEERNRKIQFKENLVDFVAPPPPDQDMEEEPETSRSDEWHDERSDFDSGESVEHKSDAKKNGLTDAEKDVEKTSPRSDEQDRISEVSSEKRKTEDDAPRDAAPKKDVPRHDEEETIVLERNGRFEVVAVKDLTPEEREIYIIGPASVPQPINASQSAPNSSRSSTIKKQPERKSSMASSVSPSDSSLSSRKASNSSRGMSVASARGNSPNDSQKVPTSARPNSQGSSQKKQQPSSSMSNMEKYEQKRKEDEARRRKQEEADEHFEAWLKKKKEEEKEKQNKKDDKDKKKDDAKDDEAFKKWKAKKEQQMQNERKMKEEEAKYYESQWLTHTDTDCEKSFKKWLKEKQKKAREKEEEDRQKMKTFQQMARRSRNSSNASSVGGQNSSAYIDYYGYRF